jgi:hypothetical protein
MMQRQALNTLALVTAIVSIMAPPTVRIFILTPKWKPPAGGHPVTEARGHPLPFGAG